MELRLLLCEALRGRWLLDPNIELRNGHLEPKTGVLLELRDESRCARRLSQDEVALEADALQRHSGGDEGLRQGDEGGRLCAGVLNVVFVDVKLDVRIDSTSFVQGKSDIGVTESIMEGVRAPGPVVIERLFSDATPSARPWRARQSWAHH